MPINGVTVGTGVTITPGVNVGSIYTGAIIMSTNSSPYIAAYAWDNTTGFGTKYANPSTPPANLAGDIAWAP